MVISLLDRVCLDRNKQEGIFFRLKALFGNSFRLSLEVFFIFLYENISKLSNYI
jgi:hypothetical protein